MTLTCGTCGALRPRDGWRPAGPAPVAAAAPPVAAACDHSAARPGALACPACGSLLPAGASSGLVLLLPWGPHRVEPGQELHLGREWGPFEAEIRAYPTVSRRHAAFRCTARGALLLTDQHSANGTFRNGYRIAADTPTEVRAGDRLSLGSHLPITVEEG